VSFGRHAGSVTIIEGGRQADHGVGAGGFGEYSFGVDILGSIGMNLSDELGLDSEGDVEIFVDFESE
jgi:hypothetical protein